MKRRPYTTRLTASLTATDGRITLLSLGLVTLVLILVLLSTSVLTVSLARKRLYSVADAAAAYAAENAIDLDAYLTGRFGDPGRERVDPAVAARLAATYVEAQRSLPGTPPQLAVTAVTVSPDGHVGVHLTANVPLPLVNGVPGVSEAVPLAVTGWARPTTRL